LHWRLLRQLKFQYGVFSVEITKVNATQARVQLALQNINFQQNKIIEARVSQKEERTQVKAKSLREEKTIVDLKGTYPIPFFKIAC